MRQVTLIYNPAAGGGRDRTRSLESVHRALSGAGLATEVVATTAPGSASKQACQAAERSDLVFACGGDGTVHEVLQGLAPTTRTMLGVVPLGSANVLARHLRLSLDPVQAAMQQVQRKGVPVALGRITFRKGAEARSRFFVSVAGAGADGLLSLHTISANKRKAGRFAYYMTAGSLCLRQDLSPFELTYTYEDGRSATVTAVSAMTSRVGSLGGLFRRLVPPGSTEHEDLLLTHIGPPSRLSLPAWAASSWTGLSGFNRWQRSAHVLSFQCGEGRHAPVHVQADGEWLGQTPMSVCLVRDAIRLPLPSPTSSLAR